MEKRLSLDKIFKLKFTTISCTGCGYAELYTRDTYIIFRCFRIINGIKNKCKVGGLIKD